jgi:hypothetical protein
MSSRRRWLIQEYVNDPCEHIELMASPSNSAMIGLDSDGGPRNHKRLRTDIYTVFNDQMCMCHDITVELRRSMNETVAEHALSQGASRLLHSDPCQTRFSNVGLASVIGARRV